MVTRDSLVATQRGALDVLLNTRRPIQWLSGLGGSGKTTLLSALHSTLKSQPESVTLISHFTDYLEIMNDPQSMEGSWQTPTWLIVDDADEFSTTAIHEIVKARSDPKFRTVLGWNSLRSFPNFLGLDDIGQFVELGPWPDAELKEAARLWVHEVDDLVITAAGGNPGLLHHAVNSVHTDAHAGSSVIKTAAHTTPDNGTSVLGGLAPSHQKFLAVGALLGDEFSLEAISHGLDTSWLDIAEQLSYLIRAGILVPSGEKVAFRHRLFLNKIQRSVSEPERLARCRAIAEGMIESGSRNPEICRYIVGARWLTDISLAWVSSVAPDWSISRPEALIPVLELFIDNLDSTDRRRQAFQTWLAQSLFELGRASDVELLLQRSMDSGDDGQLELSLRLNLSGALLLDNKVSEALRVLEDGSSIRVADEQEKNNVLAVRSLHLVLAGEIQRGEADAKEALFAGKKLDNPLGMSVASSALAHVAYYSGAVLHATLLAKDAVAHADRSGSHEAARRSRYELGMFNMHADLADEAQDVFEQEAEISQLHVTSKWYRPLPLIGLGLLEYQRGNWPMAEATLENSLQFGEEVSTRWEAAFVRAHLADMAVKRGNITQAIFQLESIEQNADDTPHHSFDAVLWARATVASSLGRHDEAFELLVEAADLVGQYQVVTRYRWLVPKVLRAARKLRQAREFQHLVDALNAVERTAAVPYISGAALLSRALVDGDAMLAERSLIALRKSHRRTDLADALSDTGELFRDAGKFEDAARHFAEARHLYASFGAAVSEASLRAELRLLGVSTTPHRRRKAPTEGPASLTPAERRVVEFVAQGMSNSEIAQQLFISPRTVETHLTKCYSKLGLTSRVALAMSASNFVR